MPLWLHKLASPPHFYRMSRPLVLWLAVPGIALTVYGLFAGLVLAPPDVHQGDAFRIIYVHVPSAWLSLLGYGAMAVAGFIALVWRLKMAEIAVTAIAPLGASFTLVALLTGSLWGKPMWGAWWVWGARLTSELILLFLYLGVIALHNAIESPSTAARASSLLALVGVINVPIIHYSVVWWHTLHQGATVFRVGGPLIATDMLIPLLIAASGFTLMFGWLALWRMRVQLLWRERRSRWAQQVVIDG